MPLKERLRSLWDAFAYDERVRHQKSQPSYGNGNWAPQTRATTYRSGEATTVAAIYNRIAMDVASVDIRHIKLDEQNRYGKDMDSRLNECFVFSPNLDQGPQQFRQDIVRTMMDHGVAAVVAVQTKGNPVLDNNFDIYQLRVGHVVEWFAHHVRVSLYNENTAKREEITLEKRYVALVENPFYSVMNEQNSTFQRLIRKLHLLDAVDEQSGSGKLDLIIQLPYSVRSESRRSQADQRREDMELQLKGSQYGIAWADQTEKITQLNRPAENNLLGQVEWLTEQLYIELGLTKDVMSGTASEAAMLNYLNRTVEPMVEAIVQAMNKSFLGRLGWRRGERISYYRDPFKLVPLGELAEITDKLSRNEVVTSNEIRGKFLGLPPADDPNADKLVNSNMPQQQNAPETTSEEAEEGAGGEAEFLDEILAEVEGPIEELLSELEA